MKKFIIASLVGAIIIFIYSAMSWIILPVHTHSFRYTPKQDTILNTLNNSSLETGVYMLPSPDNRNLGMMKDKKYMDEMKEMNTKNAGKAFAMIIYGKAGKEMDPMQFIIGIILDILAAMTAVILLVLAKDKLRTFFMRWWVVMLIGFVIALNSYLTEWNWMQFPWHFIKGEVIDTFMEWGLCGLWLAWYLRKA
ncbi:MAG TPA: hypothetical protein VK783_01620 [Bacteroidia bacterium]|jgi:hypothetical protein|nr:hypothetical protein [Bacteroidia bacterium]